MEQQQQNDTAAPTDAPAPDENQSILAELARLSDDDEAPAEDAPAEQEAGEESSETEADAEAETDAEDAEESEESNDDAEAEDPAEEDDGKPDPELAKRLEKIQRQEKRAKEAVAAERAEFERERAEFTKQRDEWKPKVEEFERLKKRAKYDPASVLMALDLTEEDLEPAARQLYALSKAGKADPKLREQSAKALRERETISEIEQLKQQNAELMKKFEEREQRAEQERYVAEYMGRVEKAVSDDAPIVGRMIEKTPEKARSMLRQAAEYLYQQTGEEPDPADVVAALEKVRRAELEELGLEIPAAGKKAAPKTKHPAKASENAVAKTLSTDLGTQTQPRNAPASDEDIDAAILRDLRAGAIDE